MVAGVAGRLSVGVAGASGLRFEPTGGDARQLAAELRQLEAMRRASTSGGDSVAAGGCLCYCVVELRPMGAAPPVGAAAAMGAGAEGGPGTNNAAAAAAAAAGAGAAPSGGGIDGAAAAAAAAEAAEAARVARYPVLRRCSRPVRATRVLQDPQANGGGRQPSTTLTAHWGADFAFDVTELGADARIDVAVFCQPLGRPGAGADACAAAAGAAPPAGGHRWSGRSGAHAEEAAGGVLLGGSSASAAAADGGAGQHWWGGAKQKNGRGADAALGQCSLRLGHTVLVHRFDAPASNPRPHTSMLPIMEHGAPSRLGGVGGGGGGGGGAGGGDRNQGLGSAAWASQRECMGAELLLDWSFAEKVGTHSRSRWEHTHGAGGNTLTEQVGTH
jgi:hypothetical protein